MVYYFNKWQTFLSYHTGKDRDVRLNNNQTPGQNPSQEVAEASQSGYTPIQAGQITHHMINTFSNVYSILI